MILKCEDGIDICSNFVTHVSPLIDALTVAQVGIAVSLGAAFGNLRLNVSIYKQMRLRYTYVDIWFSEEQLAAHS